MPGGKPGGPSMGKGVMGKGVAVMVQMLFRQAEAAPKPTGGAAGCVLPGAPAMPRRSSGCTSDAFAREVPVAPTREGSLAIAPAALLRTHGALNL